MKKRKRTKKNMRKHGVTFYFIPRPAMFVETCEKMSVKVTHVLYTVLTEMNKCLFGQKKKEMQHSDIENNISVFNLFKVS